MQALSAGTYLMQAPGVVSSLAAATQSFHYKGTALVTNTGTGLKCETDLSEPGMLSSGKKHRVRFLC